MLVSKEITLEAAHQLPLHEGKCKRMHGHTFRVRVTIKGQVGANGMVFDFSKLKEIMMERVHSRLDHQCLNDFIENPTAENLAIWTWKELKELPLHEIQIWEGQRSCVTMTREDA